MLISQVDECTGRRGDKGGLFVDDRQRDGQSRRINRKEFELRKSGGAPDSGFRQEGQPKVFTDQIDGGGAAGGRVAAI